MQSHPDDPDCVAFDMEKSIKNHTLAAAELAPASTGQHQHILGSWRDTKPLAPIAWKIKTGTEQLGAALAVNVCEDVLLREQHEDLSLMMSFAKEEHALHHRMYDHRNLGKWRSRCREDRAHGHNPADPWNQTPDAVSCTSNE